MARKLDLLTLLAQKMKDASALGTAKPTPRTRRSGQGSWGDKLTAWLGRRRGEPVAPAKSRSARSRQSDVQMPGFALAAIVLCALGLGFVLGRFGGRGDARAGGTERELSVGKDAGRQPVEPGWLDMGKSSARVEKPDEILGSWCAPVLLYDAPEKDNAERLASYLREQRIPTARIHKFTIRDVDYWGTVVYVRSRQDGPSCVNELMRVPAPAFEPKFSDVLGKLKKQIDAGKGLQLIEQ